MRDTAPLLKRVRRSRAWRAAVSPALFAHIRQLARQIRISSELVSRIRSDDPLAVREPSGTPLLSKTLSRRQLLQSGQHRHTPSAACSSDDCAVAVSPCDATSQPESGRAAEADSHRERRVSCIPASCSCCGPAEDVLHSPQCCDIHASCFAYPLFAFSSRLACSGLM
jgi:hypothetical protein